MKTDYKTFEDLKIGEINEIGKFLLNVTESKTELGKYNLIITDYLIINRSDKYNYTPDEITKIMKKIQGEPTKLQMIWVYIYSGLQIALYVLIRASYTLSIHKGMPALKFWRTEPEMIEKDVRRFWAITFWGLACGLIVAYLGWYWFIGISGFYLLLNLVVATIKVNQYKRKNKQNESI